MNKIDTFKVDQLKIANKQLEKLKEDLKIKKEQFEESVRELKTDILSKQIGIESLKEAITEEAIKEYEANPDVKKLYGGIGIRIMKKIKYDKRRALKWAIEHKICLKLDDKAFEKLAKENPDSFMEDVGIIPLNETKVVFGK